MRINSSAWIFKSSNFNSVEIIITFSYFEINELFNWFIEVKLFILGAENETFVSISSANLLIVDDDKNIKSDRIPKFKIAEGVYAKFDLKVKNEDLLPFIQWVYHEWLPRSDYETTTKPSFAIYESVDFIKLDNEYDFSFYVSINY